MNVLVVTHLYPSRVDPVLGIFVHRQVEKLIEYGHDVQVICPKPWVPPIPALPDEWESMRQIPRRDTIDGIPVTYPRVLSAPGDLYFPVTALSSRPILAWTARRLAADGFVPDVVNAHVALPTGFAAKAIATEFDVPLVTTVHGADLQDYVHIRGCKRLMASTLRASDRVVVNSSKLERLARVSFDGGLDVSVVPNGVPIEEMDAKRESKRPPEVDSECLVLTSVANLNPIKGHRFVLKALAELDGEYDLQYLIIGSGDERATLEMQATRLDIRDQVTFVGRVPHERVFEYLWYSDIFVLPSYEEAFGIAYIEAMACELPAIGCTGEGPEDFITDGENGYLVPPRDADVLIDVLDDLLANPDKRRQVGERARRTVVENYTWEQNARQVEAIYQELLGEPTTPQ